jgi:hypothetical protein
LNRDQRYLDKYHFYPDPNRAAQKVALASRYRNLMLVLFPATLGLGTAVLWLRSLSWPLGLDEAGIMEQSRIGRDHGAAAKLQHQSAVEIELENRIV